MKKGITMVLALLLVLLLASCAGEDMVLDEMKTYEAASEVHALDIQINAADFTIEQGPAFLVESNLKNLTVSEKNGVLTVTEKTKLQAVDYEGGMLKLYVPENTVFDSVKIATGAAALSADSLSAKSLELKLGAGAVHFGRLNAYSEIDIEGGAGEITIISGTLHNLELFLGVGELNMTAALLGENELQFGVGESNVTLVGSPDDYTVEIEKGVGSITVDGRTVSAFDSSGDGQNHVKIEGGVGATKVAFREE